MRTKNVTNRRICEYDISLIGSLSDDDLLHVASTCDALANTYRTNGRPSPGLFLWLSTSLRKESRRRPIGEQAERIMFDLPAEIYSQCPSALGLNLLGCMMLLRSLTVDAQTQFVGEILHDLCILSKARLEHYADLQARIEFQGK